MSAVLISFGGSKEHLFPSFPASRGCLHSLGSWPLLHLQGHPHSIFSWVLPSHGFSLWTRCLPHVSIHVINLGPPKQSSVSSLNTSLSLLAWFLKRNWVWFLSLLLHGWSPHFGFFQGFLSLILCSLICYAWV